MISVSVENVDVVLKALARISLEKEQAFDKIVRKYAKETAKEGRARVRTGKTRNLKNSIKPKYFSKEGPAATVFPRGGKGAHRHLIEYGTKNRTQKTTGRSTGSSRAFPFMRPAQEVVAPRFIRAIQAEVNKDHVI